MSTVRRDLRSYYEAEAAQATRKPLTGWRAQIRSQFAELLVSERRHSLIDFGAGPGRDLEGLAGVVPFAIGVDLAVGNAALAASRGVQIVPADLVALPFRSGAFDAGWSMSTLMHLDAADAAAALRSMAAALAPASPIWIGQWGAPPGAARLRFDDTIEGQRRPFHQRELDQNVELATAAFEVERSHELELGTGHYQLLELRAR